jgi:thiamine-phosphate pyrophosphorylase
VKIRGLYAVTPDGGSTAELLAKVRAALEGHAALLQYRRKNGNAAEARQVVELAHEYGVPLIINDDAALALEVGADGAHLGREDGDFARARKLLGGRILGASCYADLSAAQAAVRAGADYVAFGSVFASPTKPAAVRAPLSLFGEGRSLGVPLAAIGGITLENASHAVAAGADLLAVISDLFDASDIRARARDYGRFFS